MEKPTKPYVIVKAKFMRDLVIAVNDFLNETNLDEPEKINLDVYIVHGPVIYNDNSQSHETYCQVLIHEWISPLSGIELSLDAIEGALIAIDGTLAGMG